jgi:hypothetical protein
MTQDFRSLWRDVLSEDFVFPTIPSGTTLQDGVSILTAALSGHFLKSSAVLQYFKDVPKGPGTFCPDAPAEELIRYVALRKGRVPKDDCQVTHDFLETIMVPVGAFWVQMMAEMADMTDANSDETVIFKTFPEIAAAVDTLYLKWYKAVATPFQSLPKNEKDKYKEVIGMALPEDYDYTVFDYVYSELLKINNPFENRRPWATAFPDEIAEIARILRDIAGDLSEGSVLKNFHLALADAYAETDIGMLEARWTAVDELWLKLPAECRISITHGFEAYDHFKCVSPEHRLDVLFPTEKDAAVAMQDTIIQVALGLGMNAALEENIRAKYAKTATQKFASVWSAGWGMNFGFAGQAGPNREKVQEQGVRVIVECANVTAVLEIYRERLHEHCSPTTAQLLAPFITAPWFLEFIDSHELSHPVGKTAELYKAVGQDAMQWVEEAKASLLGVLANAELHGKDPQALLEMVGYWTARIIRFMDKSELSNETTQPYVRENLAMLSIFLGTGVLTVTEEGIEVNVEKAKSTNWVHAIEVFIGEVLDGYGKMDKEALKTTMDDYCNREEQDTAMVIAWVNREKAA